MTTIFKLMIDESIDGYGGYKDLAHFTNEDAAKQLESEKKGPYSSIILTPIPLFSTVEEFQEYTDGTLARRAEEKLTSIELAALLKKHGKQTK